MLKLLETLSVSRIERWDVSNKPRDCSEHLGCLDMSLANLEPVDPVDVVPNLPEPGQRWTVRRKATVIGAVRGGYVPIEEACSLYNISVAEFLAWERDMDRNGIPGLRSTRFQIYRDTDKQRKG